MLKGKVRGKMLPLRQLYLTAKASEFRDNNLALVLEHPGRQKREYHNESQSNSLAVLALIVTQYDMILVDLHKHCILRRFLWFPKVKNYYCPLNHNVVCPTS